MKFTFETTTNKTPEAVWSFYEDVAKWKFWEDYLEEIHLDGEFTEGSVGQMKLTGQPAMDFVLVSVIPKKSFVDKTTIPDVGYIYFTHELLEKNQKTTIRHSVEFVPANRDTTVEDLEFVMQIFSDVPLSIFSLIEATND